MFSLSTASLTPKRTCRTIDSTPPDIYLWNYGHQFSGHNIFRCYMSCVIALLYCLASLNSGAASKCWNEMSQRPLGQVMVLPGRQGQHQPPATTEYTGHISCLKLTLANNACGRSQRPPAYQQVPPEEGKREERGSKERLSNWPPPPGNSALAPQPAGSNRAPFQAPAQLAAEWEGAVHVYADAKMGRQAGELAFVMQQVHRERAGIMGNNLLWFVS